MAHVSGAGHCCRVIFFRTAGASPRGDQHPCSSSGSSGRADLRDGLLALASPQERIHGASMEGIVTAQKPLRLWPGVAAALLVLVGLVLPFIFPDLVIVWMMAGIVGALAV